MKNIIHVPNGSRYEENGWIRINIKGNPAQRGQAYGRLIRDLMPDIVKAMSFVMKDDYGVELKTMEGLIYDIFCVLKIMKNARCQNVYQREVMWFVG